MNIVKGLLVYPVVLKVIDFEEAVGRGPVSVISTILQVRDILTSRAE